MLSVEPTPLNAAPTATIPAARGANLAANPIILPLVVAAPAPKPFIDC